MIDIIVVGGGPAGLTAAVYGLRANKSVLVIEKETFGGQITASPNVENIPGFVSLSGNEFAEKLVDQAVNQGADFESGVVTKIDVHEENGRNIFTVFTEEGEQYESRSVVLATGAKHRVLGLEKEEEFIGNGISFCAVCDGAFYKDQVVGMVGGGNSALVEAVLLADLVKKLYIFQDLPELTGEKKLQDALMAKDNVEILCNSKVLGYLGDAEFAGVKIENKVTGEQKDYELQGLFVAIGLVPQNEPFADLIDLNKWGYADSNEFCKTKTPGIYVAGDCRSKFVRQVATAVADGAVAALSAVDYVEQRV